MSIPANVEVWNRKKEKGGAPFGTDEEDGVPPMPAFGEGERLAVTGSTHDPFGYRKTDDGEVHARLVERINEKILKNRSSIVETESYFLEEADIAVVAYGFTARTSLYVVRRLQKEGMKIGMVRLKSLWPFPEDAMREVGQKARKIVVPEMNRGQVAGEIRKACLCDVISISQTDGEVIPPEKIFDALRRLSQ